MISGPGGSKYDVGDASSPLGKGYHRAGSRHHRLRSHCAEQGGGTVSTLPAGSFFGELALITDIRRTSTVRAVTICDIAILTRRDLVEVLAEFPEVRAPDLDDTFPMPRLHSSHV